MNKRTPFPWKIKRAGLDLGCIKIEGETHQERKGNLNHINNAVNHYDEMVEALEGVVDRYCNLVNSGDAGFWNPHKDKEIKRAESLLAKLKEEAPDGTEEG